jgi:hypothetical protein
MVVFVDIVADLGVLVFVVLAGAIVVYFGYARIAGTAAVAVVITIAGSSGVVLTAPDNDTGFFSAYVAVIGIAALAVIVTRLSRIAVGHGRAGFFLLLSLAGGMMLACLGAAKSLSHLSRPPSICRRGWGSFSGSACRKRAGSFIRDGHLVDRRHVAPPARAAPEPFLETQHPSGSAPAVAGPPASAARRGGRRRRSG